MSGGPADPLPGSTNVPLRVGAIDIGTNTVLLLVVEQRGSERVVLCDCATITRLGEGVDRSRELAPEARERTLATISEYARTLRELGVEKVSCVGTSAMRDARKGAEFAREVEAVLGVAPRILAGQEEAALTFRGTLSGLGLSGPVTVFDIGGGSTEIICGSCTPEPHEDAAVSLDVGSVRLFERHIKSDPPAAHELHNVRADIRVALARAPKLSREATLVGVAGTVTTLAAISLEMHTYDSARIHGLRLPAGEISRLARMLETMTHEERRRLPGLEPKRADVIVVGAELVELIVEHSGAQELCISDRGVRWGLAEEALSAARVASPSNL